MASLPVGLSHLFRLCSHLLLERDLERELDLDLDHDLEREREDLELVAEERLLRWSWQKEESLVHVCQAFSRPLSPLTFPFAVELN